MYVHVGPNDAAYAKIHIGNIRKRENAQLMCNVFLDARFGVIFIFFQGSFKFSHSSGLKRYKVRLCGPQHIYIYIYIINIYIYIYWAELFRTQQRGT